MPDLSRRETQVMQLVCEGKSYKEIAAALCICRATVESHVYRARRKLKAVNNPHAVYIFVTVQLQPLDKLII
jgi:DNA-binding CsgD family transcriptional regulator